MRNIHTDLHVREAFTNFVEALAERRLTIVEVKVREEGQLDFFIKDELEVICGIRVICQK